MRRILCVFSFLLPLSLVVACAGPGASSGVTGLARDVAPLDEARRVTLAGNVSPLARMGLEVGAVPADTRMDKMLLLLKPSETQQQELDALVEAQQDPFSSEYHHWLTPDEFGSRFGASDADVGRVTAWLGAQGFTVDEVPAGGRLVVFSGNAGRLTGAFRTQMRRYRVGGVDHIANDADPQIPEALANVVAGVVSLHDFRRKPLIARSAALARPMFSAGATHYLFPADFAVVYDLNPLYQEGMTGAGVGIAIAARSNIDVNDVAQFRAAAGLAANAATVVLAGRDPGLVAGDQAEATLDAEWAGALAPTAKVSVVTAATTATTDGIDLAAAYIVNHAVAPVMAVSYGACERQMSASELAFYNSLWQQAAAEGISVFVASGDSGAAGCSGGNDSVGSSAAVNGMCSSPYATCVGGTQLSEGENAAQYWAGANGNGYVSALGYIPETVWNESALEGGAGLWASGGGVSAVYSQPAWQFGVSGVGTAGGRTVPDVSLAAAQHDGVVMVQGGSFFVVSGTSVSAPAFAGVMGLVVAQMGGLGQGNANPRLYALAGAQVGAFHATPAGNNSVPGVAGYAADGAVYNLATGLGSVDGAVLVKRWAVLQSCESRLVRTRCGARPPRGPVKITGSRE